MKTVLEFNSPDDDYAAWCATNAVHLYHCLLEIERELRSHRKYDVEATKTIDNIQQCMVELRTQIGEPL